MKKFFKYALLFASALVLAVGCGNNEEPDPENPDVPEPGAAVEVSLNCSNPNVKVSGSDVTVAFTVDAASELTADAAFTLTASGTVKHELKNASLTIAKGAKSASGEVVVKGDTEAGDLVLTLATESTGVTVKNNKITLKVSTFVQPPTGYCAVNSLEQNYAYMSAWKIGDRSEENIPQSTKYGYRDRSDEVIYLPTGASEVSITFDQGRTTAGDPYYIVMWIDLNGDADFEDEGELVMKQEIQANGSYTLTQKLNVPETAAKAGRVRFGVYFSENGDRSDTNISEFGCGDIDSGDIVDMTYNLVSGTELPVLSVSAARTDITVGNEDESETLTVSLTRAIEQDLVVNLGVEGAFAGACEYEPTVTIPAGETSATTTIKFMADAFAAESITAMITLSVDPEDEMLADVGANGTIVFNVKGTGEKNMATVAFDESTVTVDGADAYATFTVSLSAEASVETTIDVEVSGADEQYIADVPSTVTIAAGQRSAQGKIRLLAEGFVYQANERTLTAVISSATEGVAVNPNANSATVVVKGAKENPAKHTLNAVAYPSRKDGDVVVMHDNNVTAQVMVYIPQRGGKDVPAIDDCRFRLNILGGGVQEGVHYRVQDDNNLVIKRGESYIIADVEWIAGGFNIGADETIDIFVEPVSGPCATTSYSARYAVMRLAAGEYCNVLPAGEDNKANEWGTLRSWQVGTMYDGSSAVKAYNDLTAQPTTISKGENTFTVVVGTDANHSGDKYSVAMFIDWNGDGDFADEGENYSTEPFEIGAQGNSQTKTFTVTPPADAVASSRIRFGLILKDNIADGCIIPKFESHKVVDLTYRLAE